MPRKQNYDIRDYLDAKFKELDEKFDIMCKKVEVVKTETERRFIACQEDCKGKIEIQVLRNRLAIVIPILIAAFSIIGSLVFYFFMLPVQRHLDLDVPSTILEQKNKPQGKVLEKIPEIKE